MRKISRIILHCTDSPRTTDTVEDVRRWHKEKGWNDVGYHRLIRHDGGIEFGRPLELVGAHCAGYNSESVGIALHGMTENFTQVQFVALGVVLAGFAVLFPEASIHAHGEFAAKACPGFPVSPIRPLWTSLTRTRKDP